ncbi:MAG: PSD1 and planctomycete cytochrome C domain-containing protein [Pirellulaceae bacterium]
MPRLGCLLIAIQLLAVGAAQAEDLTFEQHIRPVLKAHCFHCHGEAGEREGGLDLRLRRLIVAGGESGAGLVPGDSAASVLLERVRTGEMPPVDKKLSADEISLLERWIAAGAKTARPEPEQVGDDVLFTQEERDFWSFQPIRRFELPAVRESTKVRTPVDRFVLAKLEDAGLSFSPDADRRTLVRRVYFDLLGLPPSDAEVERFVGDESPDAYDRLLDRLLASPHYGERWGRHWLDVAGYADSEGYTDEDTPRDWAYFYRDYVIASFNADKPFDRFIHEQLAGDELVTPPYKNLSEDQIARLAATGFLRMAPDGTAAGGIDQSVARNDVVADTLQIVSSSLMGLTVGCARCHDHRYDPIPTVDYYRLRAVFEPALDWKHWRVPAARKISLYTDADRELAAKINTEAAEVDQQREVKAQMYIDRTLEEELTMVPETVRDDLRVAYKTAAKERTDEQVALLKEYPSVASISVGSLYLYDRRREVQAGQIDAARREKEKRLANAADPTALAAEIQRDIEAAAQLRAEKAADDLKRYQERADEIRATIPPERFLRAIAEEPSRIPSTFVFFRGDHEQPKDEVAPAGLSVLNARLDSALPTDDASLPSSGRRLAFAKRLTDPGYPLTARVVVNRLWLHHFGRGIVNSPSDFGVLGDRPTHPELLDWLAAEFIESGWQVKQLHKLIMTSTAYRQSSHRTDEHEATDPENKLYARMSVRRLESEAVRDALLTVSDKLNAKLFGPPVPVMEDEVGQIVIGKENLDGERKPGQTVPLHGEEFRRSTYVQVRRSRPLEVLETFDNPTMTPNCEQRNASNVAPQSLLLMNSNLVVEYAEYFAARVMRDAGVDRDAQIKLAWQLAFATVPSEDEIAAALEFVQRQEHVFRDSDAKPKESTAESLALASLCQALLSSNRFLYVE